jgi:hypothetical protein
MAGESHWIDAIAVELGNIYTGEVDNLSRCRNSS